MPPPKKPDTSTFVAQVAASIRTRRLKKFSRAEDAAKAAGVPTQTWYHWEQGTRLPLSALPIAAKALGCSPRQLLPA
jgi:transcriptional regulator with XRE-family HTH domain